MIENLTLKRAVEFAVKIEELGGEFYKGLAEKHGDNPELKELFTLLARDEEIHQTQFKALLTKLPAEQQGALPEKEQEYLASLASAEIFYGHNEALDPGYRVETRDDALERALNLEKGSLLYYGAMRDVLGKNEILDAIIDAEKEHMMKVMQYMFTGAKMRGLMDEAP